MGRPRTEHYVINEETGCWDWHGNLNNGGYGRRWDSDLQRRVWAHRYFYELAKGPIPTGLFLDHLCRNRSCVNPDHLEPVTNAENQRRGKAVTLTWDDVRFIRANYIPFHREFGAHALGRKFNVTHQCISQITNHKSWVEETPTHEGVAV